jgi:orotidine-5'-phosphate decarboxylase
MDLPAPAAPLHERLAGIVAELAPRLDGGGALSGMGAVVGATEPAHIARLRELMPRAVFLIPGVGAQGGEPALLGPAFAPGPGAALVAASRSIAGAEDPAAAAQELRDIVWKISGS